MKLALVNKKVGTIEENLKGLEEVIIENKDKGIDFYLFSEGFIQGHSALSFNYEKDIAMSASLKSEEIARVIKIAKENSVAIGFGFWENEFGGIFDSYLVVDKNGKISNKYQKISIEWLEKTMNADYRIGKVMKPFRLNDKMLLTIFADDLLANYLWDDISGYDFEISAFIVLASVKKEDYKDFMGQVLIRSNVLDKSLIVLNELSEEACGGSFVARKGQLLFNSEIEEDKLLVLK